MNVALIGRTGALLSAAETLAAEGWKFTLVVTCAKELHYDADVADFTKLAHRLGAEFVNSKQINAASMVQLIKRAQCQVAISVNWPTLIGAEVRNCFELGVLNAHAGDLPRYRGNASPNWALLSGEPTLGLTIHQMTDELDGGPIVIKELLKLHPNIYVGEVHAWIESRLPSLFSEALSGLVSGRLKPVAQSANQASILRGYPRRPEDGRIDWRLERDAIYRLIRASSRPFAGAFTYLEGKDRVVVWRATPVEHLGFFRAVPGQICYREQGCPVVACADALLRLDEVEVDGGKVGRAALEHVGRSLRGRLTSRAHVGECS